MDMLAHWFFIWSAIAVDRHEKVQGLSLYFMNFCFDNTCALIVLYYCQKYSRWVSVPCGVCAPFVMKLVHGSRLAKICDSYS